jgi:hypothetical protein
MQNYGLTERFDQEEWGKLEPLAEPTPTVARNRGATNRRRRGEGRDTGTRGEGSTVLEEQGGSDEQGRREENENSETEEARRAMAETIGEMEREEEEHGHILGRDDTGGTEGQRRTRAATPRKGP